MPDYWMITNRKVEKNRLGRDRAALTFWSSGGGPLDRFQNWRPLPRTRFLNLMRAAADRFPLITDMEQQARQKHVTLFVHGYDNSWEEAARRYEGICRALFGGADGLGLCILFTWPSDGMKIAYYADRKDAAASGADFAEVLQGLYDLLGARQEEGVRNPRKACRAKTSIIAHSMGNYVLQKAMQMCWTRKNQPLLVSLVNQLVMVAADVDNDLFTGGEAITKGDGDAIANLTYRISALYSGRDPVLGLSAGMKHFGKRRLGRSGLDRSSAVPDNVWDVDCSPLIPEDADGIHSIYFSQPKILDLMRQLLAGTDRKILAAQGLVSNGGAAGKE